MIKLTIPEEINTHERAGELNKILLAQLESVFNHYQRTQIITNGKRNPDAMTDAQLENQLNNEIEILRKLCASKGVRVGWRTVGKYDDGFGGYWLNDPRKGIFEDTDDIVRAYRFILHLCD